jgi:hypothetical protein
VGLLEPTATRLRALRSTTELDGLYDAANFYYFNIVTIEITASTPCRWLRHQLHACASCSRRIELCGVSQATAVWPWPISNKYVSIRILKCRRVSSGSHCFPLYRILSLLIFPGKNQGGVLFWIRIFGGDGTCEEWRVMGSTVWKSTMTASNTVEH